MEPRAVARARTASDSGAVAVAVEYVDETCARPHCRHCMVQNGMNFAAWYQAEAQARRSQGDIRGIRDAEQITSRSHPTGRQDRGVGVWQ